MFRPAKIAFASISIIAVAAPGQTQRVSVSNGDCEVFRVLPDGREVRTKSASNSDGAASASRGGASARSSSMSVRSSSGHSRSSASAFSSSSSGSRGTARAVSSVTDEDGRTVTTTHDEKGCRIVIDDR